MKNCVNCKHSKTIFGNDSLHTQLDDNESLTDFRKIYLNMYGRCKARHNKTYFNWWKNNGSKRSCDTVDLDCHEPK